MLFLRQRTKKSLRLFLCENFFYDEKKDEIFNFEDLSVFIKVKFLVNEETYKMLRKSCFSYEEWEMIYAEILKEIEAEEK